MIFAIEGMDGVVKTSCAKTVAGILNYEHISTPIKNFFVGSNKNPEFKNTMNIMYDMTDKVVKSYFIGLGNLIACRNKNNLILDRHFASNYFWNGCPESNIVFHNLIKLVGTPDMTFLLKASVETRLKRLYIRDPNGWDLKDTEKHVLGHDKMEEFLLQFKIPYFPIETDRLSEKQVVDIVISEIIKIKQIKEMQ